MANHLEQLIAEWFEFRGYVVRRNAMVGKRAQGGYEAELDVVAYSHKENRLFQVEPSIDATTWEKREQRFRKKFEAGSKYITKEVFPWVPHNTAFEQWAVLWASASKHSEVGGGKVVPIRELYRRIAKDVLAKGYLAGNAISEQFPLLRTMQFTLHWASPGEPDEGTPEEKARHG
jgi:hypothetical protein